MGVVDPSISKFIYLERHVKYWMNILHVIIDHWFYRQVYIDPNKLLSCIFVDLFFRKMMHLILAKIFA